MESFFGPPWIEACIGMAGVAWALFAIGGARTKGWRNRGDAVSAWGLLIFGLLVTLYGVLRWIGVLDT